MSAADAVHFFQALGDETRLSLLRELRQDDRTVGDLVDALQCPQPKISRHLKVLKEAGLVGDRREGRHVTYALTSPKSWPKAAREWLRLLDAGLLPDEMLGETKAARVRRPAAAPTSAATAAPTAPAPPEPDVAASTPAASTPAAPTSAAAPQPKSTLRRRADLETHLL